MKIAMKKILCSLLLVVCSSLILNAQIKSTIYGFTVGKTKKSFVLSELKKRHINYQVLDNDIYTILVFEAVKYGGHLWETYQIDFINNTIASISFNKPGTNQDLKKDYDRLIEQLDVKYARYKTNNTLVYDGIMSCTLYEDKEYRISVFIHEDGFLSFGYDYPKLYEQKKKLDIDEL